jgi:hypothetical protein
MIFGRIQWRYILEDISMALKFEPRRQGESVGYSAECLNKKLNCTELSARFYNIY